MSNSYFSFLEHNLQQEEPALEDPKNDDFINLTVRADAECQVLCDGDFLFLVNANLVVKGTAPSGEHLLQFVSVEYPDIVLEKIVDWPESGKNYLVIVNELKDLVLAETERIAAEEAKANAEEEARLKAEAERKAIEEERKRIEAEEDARRKAAEEEARIERGEDVGDYEFGGFTYTGHIKRGKPDKNGTAVWPDGTVYDGEWTGGKANGHGRMLYANGDVYEGQWKDGKKSGSGKMTWENGDSYDGNWSKDDMYGTGSFNESTGIVYSGEWTPDNNGEFTIHGKHYSFRMPFVTKSGVTGYYSGQFKDGKPEGKGKVILASGSVYEGDFHNGWRHGKGVHHLFSGDVYDGEWKEDDLYGVGILAFSDGERYEGEIKNSKMNGHGVYTWPDGSRYEGEYKDNKKSGYGVMTWRNDKGIEAYSVRYEGEWEDDEKNGHGIEVWRCLTIGGLGEGSFRYEGEFKDDEYCGHGILTHEKFGDKYEGDFVKGKKHGHGVMTSPKGRWVKYEGDWEENEISGQGIFEFRSGDVYIGACKDNYICGKGVYKYQNGDVYEGEGKVDRCDFNFIKHGLGKMTWANGDFFMYEGGWDHNRFKGSGRLVDRIGKTWDGEWQFGITVSNFKLNGDTYIFKPYFSGRWGGKGLYSGPLNKDGKPEGKGVVAFDDGSSYKGEFHNGWRHGQGIQMMADGRKKYEGGFKEDIPNGHGLLFKEDGLKIEGEFENAYVIIKNTRATVTFKDGEVLLCTWDNGPNGKAVRVSLDGKKQNELWEHGKWIKDLNVFESLLKK